MTPVFLAQNRGFFADEKIELDITSTNGGGPDIRALIAGDVEFSFTTGDNVILAHQEGKRLLMVMSGLNKLFINWAMHKEAAKSKGVTESMPLAEKIKVLKGLDRRRDQSRRADSAPRGVRDSQSGLQPAAGRANRSDRFRADLACRAGKSQSRCRLDRAAGAGDRDQPRLRDHADQQRQGRRPVDSGVSHGKSRRASRDRGQRSGYDSAHGACLDQGQSMGAQEHAGTSGRGTETVDGNIAAGSASGRSHCVLPALSPDGRTSERSVQITQDILEQAGILKKRVVLSRARHQRLSDANDRPRATVSLPTDLWSDSSGVLGVQLRKIDRSLLGVESIHWFSFISTACLPMARSSAISAITLYETFTGFFIGAIFGIGLGFALGRREVLAQILDPYVVAFNGIPRIALAPLFIIWFGIGPTSKVILVVSVVFFLTFFNTYAGVKGVDAELKNILRIMGATERQILMKITLPAIVPWITTGLKISLPYAIVAAVVGEFIAASKGLGYLINYNTSLFSTTGALGGILVLAMVVVICNEVINRAESYLLRWRPREERKSEGELY